MDCHAFLQNARNDGFYYTVIQHSPPCHPALDAGTHKGTTQCKSEEFPHQVRDDRKDCVGGQKIKRDCHALRLAKTGYMRVIANEEKQSRV